MIIADNVFIYSINVKSNQITSIKMNLSSNFVQYETSPAAPIPTNHMPVVNVKFISLQFNFEDLSFTHHYFKSWHA